MFWGIMGCWKKKIPTWQDMLKLKKIKEGVCESNSAAKRAPQQVKLGSQISLELGTIYEWLTIPKNCELQPRQPTLQKEGEQKPLVNIIYA